MPTSPELSVVVPVYNEAGNIEEFLRRMVPILEGSVESYEIIFAADPSTDGTEDLIADAATANPAVKLLRFSRRFGQPAASLAGLEHCSGRAAVIIDVDLQDPPEVIPEMLERWRDGCEVVYAQRRKRDGETLPKRIVANLGYRFMNRFSEVEIPRDTGDFRLIDRRVIDELKRFPESHGFLRGLVALIGFEQASIQYDRPARHAGRGNYNRFFGSLRIGFNGIVAFSSALLWLSTILGFVAALVSFATGFIYLGMKIAGAGFPLGNPTVVCLVLLLGGLQLICLGVAGLYIGRIYEEVKRRPRYIIERSIGFGETTES
jgi:dolichol-phosphate mannosyltransferase